MESNNKAEKQAQEEKLLRDSHNDDYWAKEYDITKDELKKTDRKDILTKIVEAGIKHKSFVL